LHLDNNKALSYQIVDEMGVIAHLEVHAALHPGGQVSVQATEARVLMGVLRNLPSDHFTVLATYPRIGTETQLLNQRSISMDIASHLPVEETVEKEVKTFFVAPAPVEEPQDGILSYFNVSSIYDVAKAPERAVLTFAPDAYDILGVLSSNTRVFGLRLVVLQGVPGSEYIADFDKHSWNLEKASYHALVADIKFSVEQDEQLRAAQATVHDREKAQYTRADGSVKEFSNFTLGSDDKLEE